MDWHPFSGPWGAFVVGVVCGAFVMTIVFVVVLLHEAKKARKS